MSQSLYDVNYKNFLNYYEQKKHLNWEEWLVIPESTKNMDGKQGFVGVLQHPHNKSLTCLYKVSKVDDNVVEHEYKILKALEQLSNYCPHFHKVYGIIPFTCNLMYESNIPLIYNSKCKLVKRNMLLMQYIQSKFNLHFMIEDNKVTDDCVLNIIKQVILTLYMAQDYRFTHYDLHSENILIRNCNPNMYIFYILNNREYFLTPTYGYIPNIIDFGFSYCETENNSLTCTLIHTQQGFTSTRFDPYSDIKLFLISTTDDISKIECRNKISKKLYNIIRNNFSGMNVQWTSGWDNSKSVSPVKLIQELIKEQLKISILFSKSDLWFDTIQDLILLPLNAMPYHDIENSCTAFLEEFVKFEDRIMSKTLLNFVLKILVKYIKEYRTSFLSNKEEETQWAVMEIKKNFLDEYTTIINYHIPSINYEKMICALLLFTQCIEGIYFDSLQKRYAEKDSQYEIMRCKNLVDFYKLFEYNFPTKPIKSLNLKSQILVIDHPNKKCTNINLSKENLIFLDKNSDYKLRTEYIYNIYSAKNL